MERKERVCSVFNLDASETVAYNNPLFPAYVTYGHLSSYPNYACIGHWHEDLEFIFVKSGRMTFNVNGTLTELCAGTGILVNSRQFHYGFSAERNECEFICILLHPGLLRGNHWFYQTCVEAVTENTACPFLYLDGAGKTAPILEKLQAVYDSFEDPPTNAASYFILLEHFIGIVGILYDVMDVAHQIRTPESPDLSAIRSMTGYIEEHYAERIALADVAAAGACSKSKCNLLFKKYLHDTPVTYITRLRLRKSLSALLSSGASIADIAYDFGFGGASYYCETFKKYYGMPPLLYKQRQTGE